MAILSKETPSQPLNRIKPVRGLRESARSRAWTSGVATLLAAACIAGIMDRSIRSDPFTDAPSLWQWFSKPQPHPALAIMPVLPMGAAGVLSWRPNSTAWLLESLVSTAADSKRPSAAELFGTGVAHAQQPVPRSKTGDPGIPETEGNPKSPDIKRALDNKQPPNSKELPNSQRPIDVVQQFGWQPDPVTDPSLPRRAALPTEAYLAGCDVKGETCVRWRNDSAWLSVDGGLNWTPYSQNINGPFLVTASANQPHLIFSIKTLLFPDAAVSAADQDLLRALLRPFSTIEYGLDAGIDGLQGYDLYTSYRLINDYLVRTGAFDRMTFAGITNIRDGSAIASLKPPTRELFLLFPKGRLQRTLFAFPDSGTRIEHRSSTIDLPTNANLRSLYFQLDEQIGWISSGWNDGNEEGAYPAIFQTQDGGTKWERLSYRYRYAPWLLYVAAPAFILAFFAAGVAWRPVNDSPIREGIVGAGTSDSPIGWGDPDVLGLKQLALALSRFVRNTSTAPPLTIAITGPWGTGKSSLMNLVAEDLRRRGANPVLFNAWHHQKEENIFAALLENIRAQAIPSAWRLSGLAFRWRLLFLRMGKNLFALLIAIAVVATLLYALDWRTLAIAVGKSTKAFDAKAVSNWLDKIVGVGAGAALLLLVKIYATLDLKPSELMATLRGNAKLADFSAQLGFRYKFAIEFNAAGQALRTPTNPGLVIFIDDLDRCAPGNLMEVLESINFLTTAGPCFIFLGMDEPKIVEIVAKQYADDQERARQYLKKLINLTIPVPEIDELNSVILSAGAGPAAIPTSPWPKRVRAILRTAPDIVVPALALVAAIAFLSAQFATMLQKNSSAPPAAVEQPVDKPAPGGGAAGPSAPIPNPQPGRAAPSIEFRKVTPDRLASGEQAWEFLVIGLTVLIVVLLVARRVTTAREDRVEDSANFRDALAIWHPAVFAADPTPRGVKRHQNRLRLQAMRLRPGREEPDILDRWFSGLPAGGDPANDQPVNDPTLVALGAIYALCGDIPDRIFEGDLPAQQNPDAAIKWAIIAKCLIEFKRKFPGDWPPAQASTDTFRDL
jgi:hypothetical protein